MINLFKCISEGALVKKLSTLLITIYQQIFIRFLLKLTHISFTKWKIS